MSDDGFYLPFREGFTVTRSRPTPCWSRRPTSRRSSGCQHVGNAVPEHRGRSLRDLPIRLRARLRVCLARNATREAGQMDEFVLWASLRHGGDGCRGAPGSVGDKAYQRHRPPGRGGARMKTVR